MILLLKTISPRVGPRRAAPLVLWLGFALGCTSASAGDEPERRSDSATVVVTTKVGDKLRGTIMGCSPDSIVLLTSFGELSVPLEGVQRIEFGEDVQEEQGDHQKATDPTAAFGLAGYTLGGAGDEPVLPDELRVGFRFALDPSARDEAEQRLEKLVRKQRFAGRTVRTVDHLSDAGVVLVLLSGGDVRSETRTGTEMRSYIDVHQGGQLKSVPVPRTYTVTTTDVLGAVLVVDHVRKKVWVLYSHADRWRTDFDSEDASDAAVDLVERLADLCQRRTTSP